MNRKDIDAFLEEGEGARLEFKRKVSSPEKIARTLVAFANTKGGSILFGVDDDKSVVGVDSEKAEVEMIKTAGSLYCDPSIDPLVDIVAYNGKDVIVVTVPESGEKPHYLVRDEDGADGEARALIRINDKTVIASREMIQILEAGNANAPPLRIAIGEWERSLFEHLMKHERVTVKEFSDLAGISLRQASRILVRLVRAGLLRLHASEREEFYTRSFDG